MTERPATEDRGGAVITVLTGPRAGASVPLPIGRPVTIRSDLSADIVLRGLAEVRMELVLEPPMARIILQDGEIALWGCPLAAPATARLPAFIPLRIGETTVAWGWGGSERWQEAIEFAQAEQRATELGDGMGEAVQSPSPRRPGALRVAAAALPVLAAAALIAAAASPLWASSPPKEGVDLVRLNKVIQAHGLGEIHADRVSDRIVIRGLARDAHSVAELYALLGADHIPAVISVDTNASLQALVSGRFSANGIQVGLLSTGLGRFKIVSLAGSAANFDGVRIRALKEIRGVREIEVAQNLPLQLTTLTFGDRGKQIAEIVLGPGGHISTIDGSVYFSGSALPGGGTVLSLDSEGCRIQYGSLKGVLTEQGGLHV